MILLPVQTKPFIGPKMVDETALNLSSIVNKFYNDLLVIFDHRLNSAGTKCARGVLEFRNKKWLNPNLICGTNIKGRSSPYSCTTDIFYTVF